MYKGYIQTSDSSGNEDELNMADTSRVSNK